MNTKRIIPLILYLLLGIALVVCGGLDLIDSFWSGMGGALLFVGALRILQTIRYQTNPQYKEQTDTAIADERNRFIRMKAWSWAGYLFIILAAVATIVCKVMSLEREMMLCGAAVCLLLVLYWVSYFILHKKY